MIMQLWPENDRNVKLSTPIGYFRRHFCGATMRRRWKAPEVELSAPKTKPKDFVPWFLSAPVVSDRARSVLEPLLGSDVEFLPLITLRDRQFWAMNVTSVVDCLDVQASQVVFSPDDGSVMNVLAYRFVTNKLPNNLMFKVPEPSAVFLRPELAAAIRAEQLTGARFVDPGVNQTTAIMHGGPFELMPRRRYRAVSVPQRRRTTR